MLCKHEIKDAFYCLTLFFYIFDNKPKIFIMKRMLFFIALSGLFAVTSCGNKQESSEAKEQSSGFAEIDLSSNGMNLTMSVPDSVKDKLKIAKISDMQVIGEVGEYGFNIFLENVDEEENMEAVIKADMDTTKAEIAKSEENKFKRYIAEEPNAIFWESDDNGAEFHFMVIVPAEKNTYYKVESNGSLVSETLQKAIFDYVKTMKPKAAAQATAS